jgi:hypothetical protein
MAWGKPTIKLTESAYVKRAWVIDLDQHFKETGVEITPRDLFDSSLWSNIRTRKLFDRGDVMTSLSEGEICRVVRQEGDDPLDIDLQVKAALPGGLIMELRGARTPWSKLVDVEKKAAVQRRQAAQEAAAAVVGQTR